MSLQITVVATDSSGPGTGDGQYYDWLGGPAAGLTSAVPKLTQRRGIQHLLGQQLLQLGVLVLELPQPLGLRDVHPAEFSLPIVQRRFRDAVLARQISRLRTGLMLAQHANNLLFRKPGSLYRPSFRRPDSNFNWRKSAGVGQPVIKSMDGSGTLRQLCATAGFGLIETHHRNAAGFRVYAERRTGRSSR
jgi:hypothetical protein